MSADILIVDDEADIRTLIKGILEDEGYQVREAASSAKAYEAVKAQVPDLIIQDIWLQGSDQDGIEVLTTIKQDHPVVPFLMISGHGTIETAVSAIKEGAYDFIEKPFKTDRLLLMISRALETAELRRENEALKKKSGVATDFIGESQAMVSLRQSIQRVAKSNSRVFLTGEPGTGKDLAARMIYRLSDRAKKPFVVLNCAALHPDRFEAELFGKAGNSGHEGLLEQAHEGTLFLDEVADLPQVTQGKIVRVLQEQKFQRVGGTDTIHVDVRIIASTNRNLEDEIAEGRFREDLYYRLNVVPVRIPPLRSRVQDIPALAEYFLEAIGQGLGLTGLSFSSAAMSALQSYKWHGNVRQLRNMIEWILIMHGHQCDGGIDLEHLPPDMQIGGAPLRNATNQNEVTIHRYVDMPLREAREMFEREYLQTQMNKFDGHVSNMAQFVGMERSALHRKLKSLNILGVEKAADTGPPKGENQKKQGRA